MVGDGVDPHQQLRLDLLNTVVSALAVVRHLPGLS